MKIKIYGGPLSISYNLAKFLRRKGIDVIFYSDSSPLDESYRPLWEDGDDKKGDWIKEVDVKLGNCIIRTSNARSFIKELKTADILHTYGESSIWASMTGVPYIYNSYGYDLDQMPFRTDSVRSRILSHLLRRSIRKAKRVIISPHQRDILKRLKINIKTDYIPCPIDTDKYKKHPTPLRNDLLNTGQFSYIFFSPTRHEWSHSHTSNKGNDRVINAFSKFTGKSVKKALLILVEKGDDLQKSKDLIKQNGIEKYVMWIKPCNKEKLIEFYSASDIVFDQFTLGAFGQVFLESMSCGVPTFIYLEGYEPFYGEDPPCINVSEEKNIFNKLMELTQDPASLKDIGERSRDWILKYHDWRVSVREYDRMYKSILG